MTGRFANVNVLTVEDDQGSGTLFTMILRRLGINTFLDTTGKNVLTLAHQMNPRPDIIFLDLMLPETSGFEIIEQIRADEDLKDVKVVAVTALNAYTTIPKCKEAGFNGFIAKPIRRERLIEQLESILDGEEVWDMR